MASFLLRVLSFLVFGDKIADAASVFADTNATRYPQNTPELFRSALLEHQAIPSLSFVATDATTPVPDTSSTVRPHANRDLKLSRTVSFGETTNEIVPLCRLFSDVRSLTREAFSLVPRGIPSCVLSLAHIPRLFWRCYSCY